MREKPYLIITEWENERKEKLFNEICNILNIPYSNSDNKIKDLDSYLNLFYHDGYTILSHGKKITLRDGKYIVNKDTSTRPESHVYRINYYSFIPLHLYYSDNFVHFITKVVYNADNYAISLILNYLNPEPQGNGFTNEIFGSTALNIHGYKPQYLIARLGRDLIISDQSAISHSIQVNRCIDNPQIEYMAYRNMEYCFDFLDFLQDCYTSGLSVNDTIKRLNYTVGIQLKEKIQYGYSDDKSFDFNYDIGNKGNLNRMVDDGIL